MARTVAALAALVLLGRLGRNEPSVAAATDGELLAGFAETDITPALGRRPVFLAGFGRNRRATGLHDPLRVRAVVLRHGTKKIALASVDVVGLFHETVVRIRGQLRGFDYVLVNSTHNHEGPDTLGLWGPTAFRSGVDPDYMRRLEGQVVRAVERADEGARPVVALVGTVRAPELLHDAREPYVKLDELVAVELRDGTSKEPAGVVVQWNCHPETLGSKNTEISADFIGATVAWLSKRRHCPVVYLTGAVGGLMTSMHVDVRDEAGRRLGEETYAKTRRYGELVGALAERALGRAKPIRLAPLEARRREVFLPLDNRLYRLARALGVLDRQAFAWTGDPRRESAVAAGSEARRLALRTEVGWLRLGELEVAAVPGEIYPELVLGKVQDPADPGADFPDAPMEPALYASMLARYRMVVGLANDELGYIIPKRQWDEKAPFCYGRRRAQYGEENSVGPETAPILCREFRELVRSGK